MVTSSPSIRKRGETIRSIRFLRTITRFRLIPTFVSAVTARAVVRHIVSASGNANSTFALPFESVVRSADQNAVSGKALRTLGSPTRSGFNCPRLGRNLANLIARLPASPRK